jgi:radical SAM enzyme (TIGR01210 family)
MTVSRQEIESLRPPRPSLSAWSKPRVSFESEPDGEGGTAFTTAVFLTGAECPFRCSMCDLWKHTTKDPTPVGAIPFQLREALREGPEGDGYTRATQRWVKLYNASNFFDPRAIPAEDYAEIADLCRGFDRVVVENHPKLSDERVLSFARSIDAKLEIAMGLETVHPAAMQLLNKSMTLADFESAVQFCSSHQIDVRAFVLLHPPGVERQDSVEWTWKTIDFAFETDVRHVSVIPVRSGNGWVDQQCARGQYSIPDLQMVSDFFSQVGARTGSSVDRVLVFDLWDWEKIPGGTASQRDQLFHSIQSYNTTQHFDLTPRTGEEQ